MYYLLLSSAHFLSLSLLPKHRLLWIINTNGVGFYRCSIRPTYQRSVARSSSNNQSKSSSTITIINNYNLYLWMLRRGKKTVWFFYFQEINNQFASTCIRLFTFRMRNYKFNSVALRIIVFESYVICHLIPFVARAER